MNAAWMMRLCGPLVLFFSLGYWFGVEQSAHNISIFSCVLQNGKVSK